MQFKAPFKRMSKLGYSTNKFFNWHGMAMASNNQFEFLEKHIYGQTSESSRQ